MHKNDKRKSFWLGLGLAATFCLQGCGDCDETSLLNNNNIGSGPVAVNDTFASLGNATLNQGVATGVLTNDTPNGANILAFDATGSQGGALALNADGSFQYQPLLGFVGSETFNYTLSNSFGTSTATITFTSSTRAIFVDNTAAAGGNGTQAFPFNNMNDALAVVTTGDTIFVARGDGTTTGQNGVINLPAGVNLVGQGSGLILPQTIVPAGLAPVVTGPIICGGNQDVRGFTIQGSGGVAVRADGVSNVVVRDNSISDANGRLILFTNVGGTASIINNAFSLPANDNEDWVQFNNNDTNGTFNFTDNTFDNSTGRATEDLCQVELTGNSQVTCDLSRNTASSDTADIFSFGMYVTVEDDAQVTANITGNLFKSFSDVPIELCSFGPNVRINGTVSTNNVSDVSNDNGIAVDSSDGLITVSNNVLTNIGDDGVDVDAVGLGGAVIVDGNRITNILEDGIDLEILAPGDDISLGIRNNTVTTTVEDAIDIDWFVLGGVLCVDLVNNTVDGDIQFEHGGRGGSIQVEQLSTLNSINTLNGGAMIGTTGVVAEVADGACVFP